MRLKSPIPAEFTPPRLTKVVAEVPPAFRVPESVNVPFTLLIRLLRKLAVGESGSGLTAEDRIPESVLLPRLKIADPRSPTGPRPSKFTSRVKVIAPAVPSNTSDPPPNPIRLVFKGVVLVVRIETAPVPPSAAGLLIMSDPSAIVVVPV